MLYNFMPLKLIDPSDGKPRYIVRHGNLTHLSRDKRNAIDYVPDNCEVIEKNGHLALKYK